MILVSGGTGLVGAHLLYELCSSGKKVRALKRREASVSKVETVFSYFSDEAALLLKSIEWVEGDVLDVYSLAEAMQGVKEVYHCAAMVSFDPRKEEEMLEINVEGTANMVNAALEQKVDKFCHVSSIAALGSEENDALITEQTFWVSSPDNSNYSISKYGAEREVWRACNEGLNVIVVNPSLILGTNSSKQSSSSLFYTTSKGMKFYTRGGTGCVDVRDVTTLMIKLMESDIKNERFILNAGNVTYKKLFDEMLLAFQKPLTSIKASPILTEMAWRMEALRCYFTGKAPAITKETMDAAHKVSLYSNKKMLETFPDFRFIPIERSVKEHCERFLKRSN